MDLGGIYRILFSAWGTAARRLPAGIAPPPLQLFFEISDRCTQKCAFCFYRGDLDTGAGGELLDRREVERCVAAVPSARLVAFAGAEPFCRPDFVDILEAVSRRRITSVETNAQAVAPDLARRLVRMSFSPGRMTGLASIDASIHGDARAHDKVTGVKGSHARLVKNLRAIIEAREAAGRRFPLVHLKAVIGAENAGRLSALHRFAGELGADAFIVKLKDPHAMAFNVAGRRPMRGRIEKPKAIAAAALKDDLKKIRSHKKGPPFMTLPLGLDDRAILDHCGGDGPDLAGYTCSSPWTRLSVMPYGDYFFCKLFGYGNIRTDGPMKAWNAEPARAFRRTLAAGPLPAECEGCCFLTLK